MAAHSTILAWRIPGTVQISQESDQVVWYSHLFQNCPQFTVIHTVKGYGIVNKAEIDVFLELSCFFDDPAGSKRKRRLDSLEAAQGAPREPRRHTVLGPPETKMQILPLRYSIQIDTQFVSLQDP